MLISDLAYVLIWWVILFSLGLIFLPLTALIFHSFFDKGYIFSKILALVLVSYIVWLLGSLKILPFTAPVILLVVGLFLVINTYLSYQKRLFVNFKSLLKPIIFEEVLFLLGLTFWVFIKTYQSEIHGLEKFMDFGFINSILRSTYFPPLDMWLPPLSINYYYFGHLVGAVLIKISGIDSAIAYNLILSTIFALCLAAAFSLGANLYRFFLSKAENFHIKPRFHFLLTIIAGVTSSFLVTLGGNLQTIYAFFKTYSPPESPVPFWQLPFTFNLEGYWYPNATRFIPNTIHEFPIYSFVVSDLHGHVLGIPFVLLLIALLVKIFHQARMSLIDFGLLGLLIATFLMTNVLDGPIYLVVISFLILALELKNRRLLPALTRSVKIVAPLVVLAGLFSLPFWLVFKPFASGIGVVCAPQFLIDQGKLGPFLFEANHCARSPLWMLMILWGFPYFVLFGFLTLALKVKPLQLLSSVFKKPSSIFHHLPSETDRLVLALTVAATVLIIIPEFFYAKDIYPAHYRANTVFKFGYQAFIILGLTCGYMITRLLTLRKVSLGFFVPFVFLFLLVAVYPYFAVNSYFNGLKTQEGLNGLQYLEKSYPDDYRAISWLRSSIVGQPVILEAQGDSYTDYARVSANTGLPTVIGWPVHEWLWRGSYDEAGRRNTDVANLYESPDLNLTQQLIRKYNIQYIFIGTLERQKYPNLNEEKFQALGKLLLLSGNTRIYQIF